jgi:molybdenum cofactor cytidylyltransferase
LAVSKNIAGIILAAGEGKRIGGNKALLKIGDLSFLEIIAAALKNCQCDPIVAVLGAEADAVKNMCVQLKIGAVVNENWQIGQFSSLRKGLRAIRNDTMGAMIALVDHPMVSQNVYDLLCHMFSENPTRIIIPIYDGRRGHPIIIPHSLLGVILRTRDEYNMKDIIREHSDLIIEQLVNDNGIRRDIDTDEDYKAIS